MASAAGISSASEYPAQLMAQVYDKPTKVIYNGYEYTQRYGRGSCRAIAQRIFKPNAYIYYAGHILNHQLPAFNLLIEALARLPGIMRLAIRLLGRSPKG